MGWASGSEIARDIIIAAKDLQGDRVAFFKAVIESLDKGDWDTHDEAMGLDVDFDQAMKIVHPWMGEDDEDEGAEEAIIE